MITKKKSQKRAALKALFLVPLSMFAVAAFATEEASNVFNPVSEIKVTDFIQKDTIKAKKVVRVLSSTTTYEGDSLMHVKVDGSKKPIIYLDDKEVSESEMNSLDPSKIKTIDIHKGRSAVDEYGKKGENGVILITTKESSKKGITYNVRQNVKDGTVVYEVFEKNSEPGVIEKSTSFRFNSKNGMPDDLLFVIDGIVNEKFDPKSLDTDMIESITVLKGEAATKEYGDKGKKGVILITLKK